MSEQDKNDIKKGKEDRGIEKDRKNRETDRNKIEITLKHLQHVYCLFSYKQQQLMYYLSSYNIYKIRTTNIQPSNLRPLVLLFFLKTSFWFFVQFPL